jgi:hypothetical protein
MRYFNDVLPTDVGSEYQRKFIGITSNASNVFLVDAANEYDAINASASVLFGPFSADTAATVNAPDPKPGSHWFVVYLGAGPSTPTWFLVESATVQGNTIRLIYSKAAAATQITADIRRYYFWIPLGKLEPGTYIVELYDSNVNAVTLSRRVYVSGTNVVE